ncbi:MAG: type II toxin-antitoxin system RelE/ParE family toxin [Clostridia bacterium]|nr:type II toxin-antitoxin system RelE/ParE family toxin [Clostridia bacterium]
MKKYTVKYTEKSIKDLAKLDNYTRQMIMNWISKNLDGIENPQRCYRLGDYRILTLIEDEELIILALRIGHRRDIYKK